MPFLVPVEIKESPIEGKGLFLLQDVTKGTVLWALISQKGVPIEGFEAKENIIHSEEEMKLLPPDRIRSIFHGGFYIREINKFAELLDGNNFINHSNNPTMKTVSSYYKDYRDIRCWATRDLKKGEELT
jgi:hypothetical protein